MTRAGKHWTLVGALLAGISVACLAASKVGTRTEHTGPWLLGPTDARWSITEYADLECPYCKTYTPVLKEWVLQQKDVNLQWHHLPLGFHGSAAVNEARLAECAGKIGGPQAFWQAVDQVFERTRSNGLGFVGDLNINAVSNQDLVNCASNDKRVGQHVNQKAEEAASVGINATPTLVIRDNATGRSVKLEGAANSVSLLSAIDWLAQKSQVSQQ